MAFLTFLTFASVLGLYALYKYITSAKKNQIPKGLKKLPGPKGMALSSNHVHVVRALRVGICHH
jgi:hypothetical protein